MKKNKLTNPTGNEIRSAFQQAMLELPGPFNLSGRGHEPRCTLDRRLAAYIRGMEIPHIVISGFGANKHYPKELVDRAAEILEKTIGWSAINTFNDSAYLVYLED